MTAPLFWLSASYLRFYGWHFWQPQPSGAKKLSCNVDFGGLIRVGLDLEPDDRGLHPYINGSRATFGDRPIDFKLNGQLQPEQQLADLFYSGLNDFLTAPSIEDMLRVCYSDDLIPDNERHIVPQSWGGQAIWMPVSYIRLIKPGREHGKVYGKIMIDRFIDIRDMWLFRPSEHHSCIPLLDEILSTSLRDQLMQALQSQRMFDDLVDQDRSLHDFDGIIAGMKPDKLIPVHLGIAPPLLVSA